VQCLSLEPESRLLPQSPHDARFLGRSFFAHLDAHDLEGAATLFAANSTVDLDPAGVTGTFVVHGARFFGDLIRAFPDARFRVRSIMGNCATAVVETTLQGTQGADFLGVHNRRRDLEIDQAWVVCVSQGKIDAMRGYWCQCQLYRRLGRTRLDQDAFFFVPEVGSDQPL
jgi:SnoaL-like domain